MNPTLSRWIFNNVAGLAAKRGDFESARWLAEVYMPREFLVVAVKDAASGGHLHILQWLWENHRGRCCWGWMELSSAIEEEYHDVAEWLRSHISPRREGAHMILNAAARFGDLVTLRWVYEMFKLDMAEPLRLSLQHRQWDLASWVLENCEDELPEENRVLGFYLKYPAVKGQLEILKPLFASQNGTSFRSIFSSLQSAAGCGHLDVVKWFVEEKGVTDVGTAFRRAAGSGHLEVLKYLHEKKPDSCRESSLDDAVRAGSLEVVQWLQENTNAYCSASALDGAAELGHLEIVKWLLATRTEMGHTSAMHMAAVHGHLEVVKWLHENHKETCWRSTMSCARRGYLDVVKWLHANRHEHFALDGVMDEAAANGHLEVLQWFHDNSNEECTTDAMDGAAGNGHLDVVRWLHEHLKAKCTTRAIDNAAGNGHLEVVKWLHANRDEGCTTNAMDGAAAGKHLNVVRWLCRGCTAYAIEVSFTLARQEPCLEIVELLFSNFPICRRFRFSDRFLTSRVEIVQWLLDRAPNVLIGCALEVSPWNWYLASAARKPPKVTVGVVGTLCCSIVVLLWHKHK